MVGDHAQRRRQLGADSDHPVGLVVEGIAQRPGRPKSTGQKISKLPTLFDDSSHRPDRAVERVEELRGGSAQAVGGGGQRREGGRAGFVGADHCIQLRQNLIQLVTAVGQLLTSATRRLTQGSQQPEAVRVGFDSHDVNQLAELGQDVLEQHGRQGFVLLHHSPGAQRSRTPPVVDQLHPRYREEVDRDHPRGNGIGDARGVSGLEGDMYEVRPPGPGRGHTGYRPNQHAAELDVRVRRQTVADVD